MKKISDMGRGHDGPPKCFWLLCSNASEEEAETWWLLILIYGASKRFFWLPWLSGVAIATSLSGSTRDFLKLCISQFQAWPSPRANREMFWKSEFPTPQHRENAKPQPLGQKNGAKAPPRGNYFKKSSRKPQNMRQISRKTVLKC